MKTKSLMAVGLLMFSTAIAFSASNGTDADSKAFQIYPKNLARQHVGSNLFLFNTANQNYVPTEAAAAWLDDDVATGWPPLPGKNDYLLSFAEPQLLTNFAISTKPGATGTVTIYAGDEPAPPTAKSWTLLARDISVDSINDKKLSKPFSRYAKYLLIETNLSDPSPWYSLYVYGDKPTVSYHMEKRAQSIDSRAIFGSFVNNQTMFNLSSLYAKATVVYSNMNDSAIALQKAIDDNPESSIMIAPSKEAGLVLQYGEARQIQRLSIYCDPSAKGRLDFFLVNNSLPAAPVAATNAGSQYLKVSNNQLAINSPAPVTTPSNSPISLDSLTPTVSMVLDASNGRGSIDFPPMLASNLVVRWTPETAGQPLAIREINSFGDYSLNDYELVSDASAVGEGPQDASKDSKDMSKDKGAPEPVGELLPGKDPFLPAGLGAPPNLPSVLSP
jgi:hypothetical protein